MKTRKPFRKFQAQQEKIEKLEQTNSRFKRVYNEYELMQYELWNLHNTKQNSIPDDFITSIQLQTHYLEEEIEDWLCKSEPVPKT